jgi:hypothetical protein
MVMPGMPRYNKKAKRIAFNIIGVPQVFNRKKTEKEKYIDERIWFEETSRSR